MLNKSVCNRFGFLFIVLAVTACTPHKAYRTDSEVCVRSDPDVDCPESTLQEYADAARPDAGYLLAFIEFDDQGQLHDRSQMQVVIDDLYKKAATQDLLMVVFVHGWKHSAAPGDKNIRMFQKSLERISEMESGISRKTGYEARKVVGIYLGWRGASVTVPGVQELTFWDRKNTAHKVGHGGVTEVLNRLELIRKTKKSVAADPDKSRTRLVVVGHSFGGAIVFSALSQILMTGFIDTAGPDGQISNVKGFGDLVVLINPAFEALRFAPLSDMTNERRRYFQSQLPVIVVLTSEADYATKYAFPAGRWFSTLLEKHRSTTRTNAVDGEDEVIDQRSANITAAGHFEPYKTHYLRATGERTAGSPDDESVAESVRMFFELSQRWEDDEPGSIIDFGDSVLERSANSAGRNPYLVIEVDKQLIRDHNDIDDARVASFVRQLILISSQSTDLEERQIKRSHVTGK
jgi:pimeloyl-ACP methyl ester carboxylesterase